MVKSIVKAILLLCLLVVVNAFVTVTTSKVVQTKSLNHFCGSPRTTETFASSSDASEFDIPTSMASKVESSTSSQSMPYQLVTLVGKSASSLVSISFFLLLAIRRDALVLTLFVGSIFNAVSSKVLKKVLNHERPANLQLNENVKLKPSDGGMVSEIYMCRFHMITLTAIVRLICSALFPTIHHWQPSSHAMSLGFIGTVITCAIIPMEIQYLVGPVFAAYSLVALRYRIRDHLHTPEQVIVGLVFGVLNALTWLKYALGDSRAGPVFSWIKDNCVSADTGLFPYAALSIPMLVGLLVVGSFERRIALWLKNQKKESKVQ
eukprot:scaffold8496_cov66-Cyclotella_meneghiniana.AAC.6